MNIRLPQGAANGIVPFFKADGQLITFACEDDWYYVQFFLPCPIDSDKSDLTSDAALIGVWVQMTDGDTKEVKRVSTECPFPSQEIRVAKLPRQDPCEQTIQ